MSNFDIAEVIKAARAAKAANVQTQIAGAPTAVAGLPFEFMDLDLSEAQYTNGRSIGLNGFAFYVLKSGSDPTARIDVINVGKVNQMAPGNNFRAPFSGLVVRRSSVSSQGTIRIAVATNPEASLQDPESGSQGLITQVQYSALYNSVLNVPSLVTDGISLQGIRGLRAYIACDDDTTITAGTAVWWVMNPAGFPDPGIDVNSWHMSGVAFTLPTGRRLVALPDQQTLLPYGRAFLELRSVTTASGITEPWVALTGITE